MGMCIILHLSRLFHGTDKSTFLQALVFYADWYILQMIFQGKVLFLFFSPFS